MSTPVPRVAVVSALEEEIGAFSGLVHGERSDTWNGVNVTIGTLGSTRIVLSHTGTGMGRARAGVEGLLDHESVDVLFFVGVAGALDPTLEVGSVLVPDAVQHEQGEVAPAPDEGWRDRTAEMADVPGSTLVTVDRVITRPEEKATLWNALDQSRPAAIDMETYSVAQAAAENGVPYVSLRVISDEASERLPDLLKDAQREDGGIDRTRVMRDVVWSPSAVPALMRMRRRVQTAADVLADLLTKVLPPTGARADT